MVLPGSQQPACALARPEPEGHDGGRRGLLPSPSRFAATPIDEPKSPLPGGVPSGNAMLGSASLLEELHFYFPSSLVESPPRIPISAAQPGEAWEVWEHLPLPSADTRSRSAEF